MDVDHASLFERITGMNVWHAFLNALHKRMIACAIIIHVLGVWPGRRALE
jgi:hypothetical protein